MSENTWGYKNLTKWALILRAPYAASGLNEIIATAVSKSEAREVAGSIGATPKQYGQYEIVRLPEAQQAVKPCTCALLVNGTDYRCEMHPLNKALTFEQRMDFEQRFDQRVKEGKK